MLFNDLIQSRKFWLNVLAMLVITLVIAWLGFKLLNIYTRHGSNYVVPDFAGMTPDVILDNSDYNKFNIIVIDSIFDNSRQGGTVIDQDPPAGTEVKRKRTIHLTIVSKQQEMVSIPDLGNTARSAKSQLEAYGLALGKVIETPNKYAGLLLGAFFMGKRVEEGDKIPKGSRIDIEVGTGNEAPASEGEEEGYPDLSDDMF